MMPSFMVVHIFIFVLSLPPHAIPGNKQNIMNDIDLMRVIRFTIEIEAILMSAIYLTRVIQ